MSMNHGMNRRQALLGILGLGGTAAAGTLAAPVAAAAEHPEHPVAPPDAVGMLYDNTHLHRLQGVHDGLQRGQRLTSGHLAVRRPLGHADRPQLKD